MPEPPRDSSIEHLQPRLAFLVGRLVEYLAGKGEHVRVIETARSLERQDYLWRQGRTAPGPIVTHAQPGESKHTPDEHGLSRACDLCWVGADPFGAHPWAMLGDAAEMLGLKWGGRLTIRDYGHCELP